MMVETWSRSAEAAGAVAGVERSAPRAAYVHIPFCAHKCGYCDFASLAGAEALAERYLDALERELALRLGEPRAVATLFVGGGTPTRLEERELARLMRLIEQWFRLESGGEWTVEANPETLDNAKVELLAEHGVNRLSLGAQSFQPTLLRTLERVHGPDSVPRAVELIRSCIERWSLDLIFGVPGSTLEDWQRDLETALALEPDHLSCYGLVYEKGTPLWKQRAEGAVRPVDEEVERAMYEHTIDRLRHAGLFQYEISNFARPGQECRHNLAYWANEPYFGVGLGATRYMDGERASNTRDLMMYLRRLESEGDPTGPRERLEPENRARETAVLMLRRTRLGIERGDFFLRTGFDLDALCRPAIERGVRRGWLEDDGRVVRLTREGLFVADSVMSELL